MVGCSEGFMWIPPVSGLDDKVIEAIQLLESRSQAYRAIEEFMTEASLSQHPVIALLVAEPGDGRTSVYEALIARSTKDYGLKPVYLRASSLKGGLYQRILDAARHYKDGAIVFVDEAEDLVLAGEELLEESLESLLALTETRPSHRLGVVFSLTPPAYTRLIGEARIRGLLARLMRRTRIVWLKPIEPLEAYRVLEYIASRSHPRGLQGIFESIQEANSIIYASAGNLGLLVALYRRLAAFSANTARRLCGAGKATRIGDEELVSLLLEEPVVVAGVGLQPLSSTVYSELEEILGQVFEEMGYTRAEAKKLLAMLVARIAVDVEEAAERIGVGKPVVIEAVRRLPAKARASPLLGRLANKLLVLGEWGRIAGRESQGLVVVDEQGAPRLIAEGSRLIALTPVAIDLLFNTRRLSELSFLPAEERMTLLREAYREYKPVKPLTGLLVLLGVVDPRALAIEDAKVFRDDSILARLKLGEVRPAVLFSTGACRALEEALSSSTVMGIYPHLVVTVGHGPARLEDCKARLEEKYMARIVAVGLDYRRLTKLLVLGHYLLKEMKLEEVVDKLRRGKLKIPWTLLALEADRILPPELMPSRLAKLLEEGVGGTPLVISRQPRPGTTAALKLLALVPSRTSIRDAVRMLRGYASKHPPRPWSRRHPLAPLYGRIGVERVVADAVRMLVSQGAISLEDDRISHTLAQAEKSILRVLRSIGSSGRWISLEELKSRLIAPRGEDLIAWLELLQARGLIEARRRNGSVEVRIATREDIARRIRAVEEKAKRLVGVKAKVISLVEGIPIVASVADAASLALEVASMAAKALEAGVTEEAARLSAAALYLVDDLEAFIESHERRMKLAGDIVYSLERITNSLEKLIGEAMRLGYHVEIPRRLLEELGELTVKARRLLESSEEPSEAVDEKLLRASGGDLAIYLFYKLLAGSSIIGLPVAHAPSKLLEHLRMLENLLGQAMRWLEKGINEYGKLSERLAKMVEKLRSRGLNIAVKEHKPIVARITAIRGLKDLEKTLKTISEKISELLEEAKEYEWRLRSLELKLGGAEAKLRKAVVEEEELKELLAKLRPTISPARASSLLEQAQTMQRRALELLKDAKARALSPSEAVAMLEEVEILAGKAIELYREARRELLEELRTNIRSELGLLENIIGVIGEHRDQYRKIMAKASWAITSSNSVEELVGVLTKIVEAKNTALEELASRGRGDHRLIKTYLVIAEAKKEQGELSLSDAAKIVSSRLGMDYQEARKSIIKLIEVGVIEPRL
ncbi:MAG: hypothetical protein ABWW69_02530 [Pyrodictiaceae archaeon]